MIIMLILNSVSGNAYNDMKLKEKVHQAEEQKNLQRLLLTRAEMEKSRLRKQTSNGLDIGVSLNPGTTLKDGDVLTDNGNFIIDCHFGQSIIEPVKLESKIQSIAGVVEVGLFTHIADAVIIGSLEGIEVRIKTDGRLV